MLKGTFPKRMIQLLKTVSCHKIFRIEFLKCKSNVVAYTKTATFHGRQYHLTIVDTAGQQIYSLHPKSCAIVHGYILVYAINSRQSFDILKAIHDRILDTVG